MLQLKCRIHEEGVVSTDFKREVSPCLFPSPSLRHGKHAHATTQGHVPEGPEGQREGKGRMLGWLKKPRGTEPGEGACLSFAVTSSGRVRKHISGLKRGRGFCKDNHKGKFPN